MHNMLAYSYIYIYFKVLKKKPISTLINEPLHFEAEPIGLLEQTFKYLVLSFVTVYNFTPLNLQIIYFNIYFLTLQLSTFLLLFTMTLRICFASFKLSQIILIFELALLMEMVQDFFFFCLSYMVDMISIYYFVNMIYFCNKQIYEKY